MPSFHHPFSILTVSFTFAESRKVQVMANLQEFSEVINKRKTPRLATDCEMGHTDSWDGLRFASPQLCLGPCLKSC